MWTLIPLRLRVGPVIKVQVLYICAVKTNYFYDLKDSFHRFDPETSQMRCLTVLKLLNELN